MPRAGKKKDLDKSSKYKKVTKKTTKKMYEKIYQKNVKVFYPDGSRLEGRIGKRATNLQYFDRNGVPCQRLNNQPIIHEYSKFLHLHPTPKSRVVYEVKGDPLKIAWEFKKNPKKTIRKIENSCELVSKKEMKKRFRKAKRKSRKRN
ncbi:MAG: hypothetical protein ACTSRW_16015 [Candidatus Helarchaeota archaeon]